MEKLRVYIAHPSSTVLLAKFHRSLKYEGISKAEARESFSILIPDSWVIGRVSSPFLECIHLSTSAADPNFFSFNSLDAHFVHFRKD